jgi:hypothetical protein
MFFAVARLSVIDLIDVLLTISATMRIIISLPNHTLFAGNVSILLLWYNLTSTIACDVVQVYCQLGLAYDERIHTCNWPDLLIESAGCDPAAALGDFRFMRRLFASYGTMHAY